MKLKKRQIVQDVSFFHETNNGVEFYYYVFGEPLPVYSQETALALINMMDKDEEETVKEKAMAELKTYAGWIPKTTAEDFKNAEAEMIALMEDIRRSEKILKTEAEESASNIKEIIEPLKSAEEDRATEAEKGEGKGKGRILN